MRCRRCWRVADPLLIGATGMVGTLVMQQANGRPLTALMRRAADAPTGVNVEVADSADWPARITALRPDTLICCIGTTRRKAGSDEAFRAVDQHLVLAAAQAAADAGARQIIVMTSVGASAKSSNLYLNAKGLVQQGIAAMAFDRVDIVQPGLLIGDRGERRLAEGIAQFAAPLSDALMLGSLRKYRSIRGEVIARAIWALLGDATPGRFVHQHDDLMRLGA